jgi:cytidylate kinase
MTVVTLSAAYGTGGSQVGPALAERLGVPFVDRAIPIGCAERMAVPLREALERDENVGATLSGMARWLGHVGVAFGAPPPRETLGAAGVEQRRGTEEVIREHAAGGGAVILGRAGAVVLADAPGALHVRLTGPREARVAQGMALEGVDRETAERHLEESDRAREAYVRHFYGADAGDPGLYHLVLDSTALGLDPCVELIATAARARA